MLKIVRDPERQRRMGQAARAWIVNHYLESRVLGLTAEYYRGLVESTEPAGDQPGAGKLR